MRLLEAAALVFVAVVVAVVVPGRTVVVVVGAVVVGVAVRGSIVVVVLGAVAVGVVFVDVVVARDVVDDTAYRGFWVLCQWRGVWA